jgi:hypothetical protein
VVSGGARLAFVGGAGDSRVEMKGREPTVVEGEGEPQRQHRKEYAMARRPSISDFLTNLEQPMPLGEKLTKLTRNLWRRVVLRQNCCGNHG